MVAFPLRQHLISGRLTQLLQTQTRRSLPKRAAYYVRLFESVNNLRRSFEALLEVVAVSTSKNLMLTKKAKPRSVSYGVLVIKTLAMTYSRMA